MAILKEFREFAVKGSVIDLAVGVIVGAAFGTIVKSLVDDIVMPLVGMAMGGVDFRNRYWDVKDVVDDDVTPLEEARAADGAVVVAYGQFLNNILVFAIVAWAIFLVVKGINRMRQLHRKPDSDTERTCPECLTSIPRAAKRCKACGTAVHPQAA